MISDARVPLDPRVSRICLIEVSRLLEQYRIDEVQAALDHLASSPKWLEGHRREVDIEQKTIQSLVSSWGRRELPFSLDES